MSYRIMFKVKLVLCALLLNSAPEVMGRENAASIDDASMLLRVKQVLDLGELQSKLPGDAVVRELVSSVHGKYKVEVNLVETRPDLIAGDTKSLSVSMPDGQVLQFQKRRSEDDDAHGSYWFGDINDDRKQRFSSAQEVDVDPLTWISVSRYDGRLFGTVSVRGVVYALDTLKDARQVLIKQEPTEEMDCQPLHESVAHTGNDIKVKEKSSARSEIRVLVLLTDSALKVPDLHPRFQNDFETATSLFQSSGVNVKFTPVFREIGNSEHKSTEAELLRYFRFPTTAVGKRVAAVREEEGGDVVMVVSQVSRRPGKSYVANRKENAFAIVPPYTWALNVHHQLGHLFGAEHLWVTGDPDLGEPRYRFAYRGKLLNGGRAFRTEMDRFTWTTDNSVVLNHFSDPNATYEGTALGTANNNNVVRLLNERREEIANYFR
ncbi:hypothetical protein [Pseudomonas mosselii]|uniref:hypothetical protein n=1 Tax=Pseudomonas mosselii TaxID=78327 RepID=UPI0011B36CA3|nr:hypothetical protein [Pseudomonas mosselii]